MDRQTIVRVVNFEEEDEVFVVNNWKRPDIVRFRGVLCLALSVHHCTGYPCNSVALLFISSVIKYFKQKDGPKLLTGKSDYGSNT